MRWLISLLLALGLSMGMVSLHVPQVEKDRPAPLLAQTKQELAVYGVRLVGPDGEPVVGAMVQVCDDASCTLLSTDEQGRAQFEKTPYPYEIHVLKAPLGYRTDPQSTYVLPQEGGDISISLEKDNP